MANDGAKNLPRGRAAEFLVAFDFSIRGYSAIVNSDASSPYDLLVDIGQGKILKVQVKSTYKPYIRHAADTPSYRFQLSKADRAKYVHMDIYAFVALDVQTVLYTVIDDLRDTSKSTTIDFNIKRFMRLASGSLDRVLREV